MYWPIGAPKAFALSRNAIKNSTSDETNDDVESTEPSTSSHADVRSESSHASQGNSSTTPPTNGGGPNGGPDIVGREHVILDTKSSRGGSIFATITWSTLTIWQTKPTVALASVTRSPRSMKAYGPNATLLLRPDAMIVVIQTSEGYLVSYSLATDPNAKVYATQLPASSNRHARKDSTGGLSTYRKASNVGIDAGPGEGDGIKEVNLRFRMVIRIDAGISKTLALDDELVVATRKPSAIQCINWISDNQRAQTTTELVSKMSWVAEKCTVTEMIHDRPMSLTCWITSDGRAYAIQRRSANNVDMDNPASIFQGFCFRHPETEDTAAVKAAINARFSLIALGCKNGNIDVYVVKDYMGNIPLSHKIRLPVSSAPSGSLNHLSYSPDGYCLFAGYEKGWAMWSVYGKPGATSFGADRHVSSSNEEEWLLGVRTGFWSGGGCELVLQCPADDRLWVLDVARSSFTSCYSSTGISRGLLQSGSSVVLYKGHDVPDLMAIPSDMSLWQSIQAPSSYLVNQWPLKTTAVSPDAKYIAVAGRRGLAHYSTLSGRWRTFDDQAAEHEFAVRGGMCWYQHFLIAGVEASSRYQIRVYSREKSLSHSNIQTFEDLTAPAIFITISGTESLLVYTYDNTLLHFIILPTSTSVRLVQVGQIGFHGIIRAPPRVRAISWILPEAQIEHGDPSQDVATASVIFLVDGKLVLLQPSTNEQGELKYDMRVIAQNVEYYILMRESLHALPPASGVHSITPTTDEMQLSGPLGHSLRDSLWYFDGSNIHVWSDVQDVLASAPADLGRDLPPTVHVAPDFYPVSIMAGKGIINGLDADLVQRRDVNFSFTRLSARTSLFLPQLLRQQLANFDSPAALHLSQSYQQLPYFSHALEVLLHDVLDSEVDSPPDPQETALLPTVLSFLSSFPTYLDVIVNCTRKTELRSWRTLFSYLPPVLELFEQSLSQNKLKTAAGYLLVLHTFQQEGFQVHEFARLLSRAAGELDWELCKELARFLVGIDATGATLKAALAEARLGGDEEVDGFHGLQANGVKDADFATSGVQGSSDYFSFDRAGNGS